MMELKPEYQAIVDEWSSQEYRKTVLIAVKKCQELAYPQPKMLTVDEIDRIPDKLEGGRLGYLVHWEYLKFARAVEAAVHAKQREPETVPFDYEKWANGGWQALLRGVPVTGLVPECEYTMQRIES